jgi:hypothetical protein
MHGGRVAGGRLLDRLFCSSDLVCLLFDRFLLCFYINTHVRVHYVISACTQEPLIFFNHAKFGIWQQHWSRATIVNGTSE